jgi:hypothetical protein
MLPHLGETTILLAPEREIDPEITLFFAAVKIRFVTYGTDVKTLNKV